MLEGLTIRKVICNCGYSSITIQVTLPLWWWWMSCKMLSHMYIYKYIYFLQSRGNNNVRYFSKLSKTHFFVMKIFRSHFGSFFCASVYKYIYIYIYIYIIYIYIYTKIKKPKMRCVRVNIK